MDYFSLVRDDRISDAVVPADLKKYIKRIPFHPPELEVTRDDEIIPVVLKPGAQSRYTDFLDNPVTLVSDPFKGILAGYEGEIFFKPVVLMDLAGRPPRQTVLNVNGTLKQLVIDPAKLAGKSIVQVGGLMEDILIVRLDVAESLLRRELTGFRLEKVRLVEEEAIGGRSI